MMNTRTVAIASTPYLSRMFWTAPAYSAMEMPDMTPENWRASISPDLNLLILSAPGLLSDNWNPPAAWSKPEVEARTFHGGRAPPGAERVFLH